MYQQTINLAMEDSKPDRDELILEHLPQVKMIASRIHDRLPESVCLDDLISAGVLGLIDAVDHFDATLNLKLKTYAEHKIRGAILDSLRSLDWAPRNKRKKAKMIEAAITVQEARLHRAPTEDEVAAHLEVSLEEYRRWLVETRAVNLAPMEQGPTGDSEGSDVLRFVSADDDEWPTTLFERAELRRLVARTVGGLPEVERTIVTLYYGKELTLREIAKVVALHETRVSQLKTQAILRLRSALRAKWPGPALE
ncbi:MAG: FliA/WhiG family RNA polymerase sigma factor [Bryobacterales bacterium]|nr:FliA/WhiG family RNA polymerase sigma factor [Bryobacterales bacterium]